MLLISIPRLGIQHWPGPLARLDPSSRPFALALALSIAIHALALSIQFKFPDSRRLASPNTLDVVFVNSKTLSRPLRADALAQANLDGGGNTDLDRRAKTPLPFLKNADPGRDTKQANRRVQELEARQRQLLSQVSAKTPVSVEEARPQFRAAAEDFRRRSGAECARDRPP